MLGKNEIVALGGNLNGHFDMRVFMVVLYMKLKIKKVKEFLNWMQLHTCVFVIRFLARKFVE